MLIYSIYVLKESSSNQIKYVGLTKQELNNRLSQHIYKAKGAKKKNKVQAWIISCLNRGDTIKIEMIDNNIKDINSAIIREAYFISIYKELGMELKNETDGGSCAYDGSYWKGKKQKPEHSIKISKALKGRIPRPEEIKKAVKSMIDKVYRGKDKNATKIYQYDLNMNFIKTWPSIRRIVAKKGFSYRPIWNNINGITKKSYGYIWKRSKD